jgi:hypothetical protein
VEDARLKFWWQTDHCFGNCDGHAAYSMLRLADGYWSDIGYALCPRYHRSRLLPAGADCVQFVDITIHEDLACNWNLLSQRPGG